MTTQRFIDKIRNSSMDNDIKRKIVRKFIIPIIKNRNNIAQDVENILKDIEKKYCTGEYNNKDCICAWFEFFSDVGRLHRALELRAFWDIIFPNHLNDLSESLQLFVSNYAYMRSLDSLIVRIYGFIGAVCVERCFSQYNNNWNPNMIQCVWNCHTGNLNRIPVGVNRNNNPLNPNNGLLDVINNNQIVLQHPSLVDYLLNLLINGNIHDAYNFLISIRGVGDKIACLFLRDISIIHNLNLYGDCRDLLYKPIDIWVKRSIHCLINKCNLNVGSIGLGLKLIKNKEEKLIIVNHPM